MLETWDRKAGGEEETRNAEEPWRPERGRGRGTWEARRPQSKLQELSKLLRGEEREKRKNLKGRPLENGHVGGREQRAL